MIELSVNLNKIALLRNQRDINIPDVSEAARIVLEAGAYGITVHPRPDERHTRYTDVFELSELLASEFKKAEFNIEGNPFTGRYMEIVLKARPNQATLVPDLPGASTSDHGWDIEADGNRLLPIIKQLKDAGIRVSLFMDADNTKEITQAKEIGADRVELYTEPYATTFRTKRNLDKVLQQYKKAAQAAKKAGLGVNAGHDLNLENLGKFCKTVGEILEVSIGHALVAEALEMGLDKTVREYVRILSEIGD